MSLFHRKTEQSILSDQKRDAFNDLQKQFADDPLLTRRKTYWLVLRANQLAEKGSIELAVADLQEAFMLDHTDTCVLVRLSALLRANGRAVDAAALMNTTSNSTLEKQDLLQQVEFYAEKGNAIMLSGSVAEALPLLKKALRMCQENAQAIEGLIAAGTAPHCKFVPVPDIPQLISQLQTQVGDLELGQSGGRPLTAGSF